MIARELSLENEGGSKSRLNEQVELGDGSGGGGGGSDAAASPSFLVLV